MITDPFDALRAPVAPASPAADFVARLRARLAAELAAPELAEVEIPQPSPRPARSVPERTPTMLIPYLCVDDAAAAIVWYSDVLGATEVNRYVADDGRIGHAELRIGTATLYLADEYPEYGYTGPRTRGTPVALHLDVADADAVYDAAVGAGATAEREPRDEAYGARSGAFYDPFGHRWMVQTRVATPSAAEISAAMEGYTVVAAEPETSPSASLEPEPNELGYFTLGAPDTDRAARFYGALFGWAVEQGNLGGGYRHVRNTKLPLGLTPGSADGAPMLYFRVRSLDTSAARVRELGGEVLGRGVWASGAGAECRDDQGRTFHLWEPAPGY